MSGRLKLNRRVAKTTKFNTSGRTLRQGEIVTIADGIQNEDRLRVRDADGNLFDVPRDALDVL